MSTKIGTPITPSYLIARDETEGDYGWVRLEWLLGHMNPANPKDHDMGEIMESIRRHGFIGCVTIDTHSEMLVVGHGRCETLGAMFDADEAMPERIYEDTDGMWLVPTHLKWFENAEERDAYTVGDNQTTIAGGWRDGGLTVLLSRLATAQGERGLRGTGFDAQDLSAMIAAQNYQKPILLDAPKIGRAFGVTVNVESLDDEIRLVDAIERIGYHPKRHSGTK
jgi:hypothetical protein